MKAVTVSFVRLLCPFGGKGKPAFETPGTAGPRVGDLYSRQEGRPESRAHADRNMPAGKIPPDCDL